MASPSSTSKQLIVASLPDGSYYRKNIADIEDFVRQMGEKTSGLDDFLVVYSKSLAKQYKKSHSGFPFGDKPLRLVVEDSLDLWMRDFPPAIPKQQMKFTYRPNYLKGKDAKYTEKDFLKMLGKLGISVEKSDIVLDGGNVVDNNKDKAIISDRVLADNKGKSKTALKHELEELLGMKVALIPEAEDDTTGHSDGLVSFIQDDVLLIGDYEIPRYYSAVEKAVRSEFPDVEIVRMPCGSGEDYDDDYGGSKWRGFTSAMGCYVNILMTNNALYVPQFGDPFYDAKAVEMIKAHTSKPVVTIDTSRLSDMGGSVRCMTWQMESSHHIARALYEHSEQDH